MFFESHLAPSGTPAQAETEMVMKPGEGLSAGRTDVHVGSRRASLLFAEWPAGFAEHGVQAGMILILPENKRRTADVKDEQQ